MSLLIRRGIGQANSSRCAGALANSTGPATLKYARRHEGRGTSVSRRNLALNSFKESKICSWRGFLELPTSVHHWGGKEKMQPVRLADCQSPFTCPPPQQSLYEHEFANPPAPEERQLGTQPAASSAAFRGMLKQTKWLIDASPRKDSKSAGEQALQDTL